MRKKKETARKRFGRNMRQRRLALDLSQKALGDYCGLHRTYVGAVERGERNISLDNMERIAVSLDVDVVDLLAAARTK